MNWLIAEAADYKSAQANQKDGSHRYAYITTPPCGHPFSEKGNGPWPVLSVGKIRYCLPSQDTPHCGNDSLGRILCSKKLACMKNGC